MTTYVTGIVHGLQPDALFVVIPALALPTRLASVSFIVMFVIGTIVSMAAYTLFIGGCMGLRVLHAWVCCWVHGHGCCMLGYGSWWHEHGCMGISAA